jgi:hypothetical protein
MGHGGREAVLARCFRSARVLTIEELRHRFSVSRATAFRWLGEHGYLSSYNHRGMYVTIEEVAHFDSRGLWCFKGACFSRHGTLKATVEHFVTASASGMVHEELSELLGVRVHNPLLDLLHKGAISRERVGPVFVYTSTEEEIRTAQVNARMASGAAAPRPTSPQIIAVLLELIGDPKVSREEIVARCQRSGARISRATVDSIFAKYDLDKKRAP